jgi:hypothetical protein
MNRRMLSPVRLKGFASLHETKMPVVVFLRIPFPYVREDPMKASERRDMPWIIAAFALVAVCLTAVTLLK